MAHTLRDKKKLLDRVRRIQGQLAGVERGLEEGRTCSAVLQTIAAARGAMNGLMAEVLEGHVELHVLDPKQRPTAKQEKAAQELIAVVRRYLK